MLNEIQINIEYNSEVNDIINEFYIPVLSNSIQYDRAVGYFTINSLVSVLSGLQNFVNNNGKIRIIASPKLSPDDIEIINKSYQLKDTVISKAMIRELESNPLFDSKEFKTFCVLLNNEMIDLKIATKKNFGIYHEKIGIISDGVNTLSFIGSINETENGLKNNFESFDVFTDWTSDDNRVRVSNKKEHFEKLWNNQYETLEIMGFPQAVKDKVIEVANRSGISFPLKSKKIQMQIPSSFEVRNYQEEAINAWFANGCRGILAMATGTGKTLTALYGMQRLNEEKPNLLNIIVCPYQHLVEQWYQDVKTFDINPIRCYSKYPDWEDHLDCEIKALNEGVINQSTIICTNTTFVGERMQNTLKRALCEINIIVDEVHNAGSTGMKATLKNLDCTYRLGLSATPKRHRDEENTDFIYDYFSKEVFTFTLKEAIEKKFLCEYYYTPIPVYLDATEYSEYQRLTSEIAKNFITKKDGTKVPNQRAELLLIERSRVVAGAKDKLSALKKEIEPFKHDNNLLVYCGAARIIENQNYEESYDQDDLQLGEKQILEVCKILGNDLDMTISKFTAEEVMEQRTKIINSFTDHSCQAIVAIKCLDEGVNIPSIERAFILASTTNPKEYIQRRGRVLRKSPKTKKEFAYIYDFVCFPPMQAHLNEKTSDGLVLSELKRVIEFTKLSKNINENQSWIEKKLEYYCIEMPEEVEQDETGN